MPTPKKSEKKPESNPVPLDQLHARLEDLSDKATVIENTAASEKRQLTPDEVKEIKSLQGAFKEVEDEIAALEASADMKARIRVPQERLTTPIDNATDDEPVVPSKRPYGAGVHGGLPSGTTKGSWGFRSVGEFAISAVKHKRGTPEPRILNAPSTFGSESQSSDGGFAVPPDFRQEIMKQVYGEESLLSRCDQQITKSNALSLPLDTVSPWDTSNGVTVSWLGEGGTIGGTKPKLGQLETKLNKLAALVPLTDELLEDVPAMTQWLQSKVPEKITSALNTAIINGTGVGQPLGLLATATAARVTQTAESGQGANTVVYKNILKMWGRRYARNTQRYLWLMNQDVEQQLQQMAFPAAAGSAVFPAYLPPGGLNDSPYGRLMGRECLVLEACSALGTEGDIILFDPTQYLTVMKSAGLKTDVSIHLYFDSDHVAFRFVLRFGGQLYWPAAISRQNGSSTLSPVVTLNSTRT